jgi:hypothetical protein
MAADASVASIEVDRVRELLTTDRRLAGQARAMSACGPLYTTEYRMPLSVRVRRRWHSDRKLRMRCVYGGLMIVLSAVLSLWFARSGHAAAPQRPAGAKAARVAEQGALQAAAMPPVVLARKHSGESSLLPVPAPRIATTIESGQVAEESLSARRRLQRADLWLRLDTPRAASEARSLLESALDELAGSVHGQVSLAKSCLRLGDEVCARTAIHKAVLARPGRAKYRALARQIDRAFASR